jgi:7-cyano-7-deazaguanine synthase
VVFAPLVSTAKNAVALLSGGLDSSIAVCMAMEEGYTIALAITFDYGQRASRAETRQARRISEHFGYPHKVISLPWFKEFQTGGMLLSADVTLPHPRLSELLEKPFTTESAKAVWVPNRNGVFLEIAAAFAEDSGAESIVVGFNKEEAETFPDNSLDYVHALNEAFKYSTACGIKILSPTASMVKPEILSVGIELDFPLNLLWSCYEDGNAMCGKCESCMRLKRALFTCGKRMEQSFEDSHL